MAAAQGGDHLAAQDDVLLHLGVAQIQIAVLQPGGLVRPPWLRLTWKGSSLWRQRPSTWISVGTTSMSPVGSLGFLLARSRTGAGDGDGALLIEGLDLGHHLLGLNDHLGGAVASPAAPESPSCCPTSRRFSSQPARVTVWPTCSMRSSPQVWVRYFVCVIVGAANPYMQTMLNLSNWYVFM